MKKLIFTILLVSIIGLSPIILRLLGVIDGNLSCDFISQILPLTMEAKKMLASGAPMWSWNSFMGDNFIGANNFYVFGTPFTLICSLFTYKYFAVGVIVCLLLQVELYGVTSMLYLRRMGFNDRMARLGALMYAFSSFCIISVYYFSFAVGIILFPLILLCVEDLLDNKRYAVVKLAGIVAIAIICNFYFAAMSLLGAAIYFIVRLVYSTSEGKMTRFFQGAGAVGLGVLMSSVILIPTVMCTAGSERNVAGEVPMGLFELVVGGMIKVVYLIIPRFSEGFVELYHPFANYALYLPFVSCVFVIAYVCRNGKSWVTTLLICYLAILLTPLKALFSMGASAAYVRWGYVIVLSMIVASLYAIQNVGAEVKTVKRIVVGLVGFIVVLMLLLRFKLGCFDNRSMASLALWEGVMFVVGMVALYFVAGSKNAQGKIYAGVVLFGVANMFIYSFLLVERAEVCDVENLINNRCERETDDTFRYRTDILGGEHNLSYVLNRPASSQFHSVQNKAMSDFNSLYRSPQNPFISISHHRESFDALASVREVIVYEGDICPPYSHKVVKKGPKHTIYENEHYIPMGFAYDAFITEEQFKQQIGAIDYAVPERNNDAALGMLQALVISDADVATLGKSLRRVDAVDFTASLDSVVNCRRAHTSVDFAGDTKGFKATVDNTASHPKVYFFSVPNDPGFTAWMDHTQQLKIYRANLGMMAVVVPPGRHSLDFRYLTPGLTLGAWLSLLGLIVCGGVGIKYSNLRRKVGEINSR